MLKLFCLGCLMVSVCGCSPFETDKKVLRIAYSYNNLHPVHQAMLDLKDFVETRTPSLKILLYPADILGTSVSQMVALESGAVDFCIVESPLLANYHPVFQTFSLPYLFEDEKIFSELMSQTEMKTFLDNQVLSQSFVPVSWICDGYLDYYSAENLFEDKNKLQGFKADVYPAGVNTRTLELLEAKAYEIDQEEIYLALQTGIINGVESSAYDLQDSEIEPLLRFASIDHHQLLTSFVIANKSVLNGLTSEQQKVLEEALALFQQEANENYKVERMLAAESLSSDIIYHLKERRDLMKVVEPVYEDFLSRNPEYIKMINWIDDLNNRYERDRND